MGSDIGSFRVVVISEGTLEGNHFFKKKIRIGFEKQLYALVLLETRLVATFF
jgi:hypothetical protein